MITGIGVDLVEIQRIRQLVKRYQKSFLDRVFTAAEQRESGNRTSYFAGRWAAKEAAAKALGCGMGEKCAFTDIEILDDEQGAPHLACTAPAAREKGGKLRYLVSISHEKEYATATVIVETES